MAGLRCAAIKYTPTMPNYISNVAHLNAVWISGNEQADPLAKRGSQMIQPQKY